MHFLGFACIGSGRTLNHNFFLPSELSRDRLLPKLNTAVHRPPAIRAPYASIAAGLIDPGSPPGTTRLLPPSQPMPQHPPASRSKQTWIVAPPRSGRYGGPPPRIHHDVAAISARDRLRRMKRPRCTRPQGLTSLVRWLRPTPRPALGP